MGCRTAEPHNFINASQTVGRGRTGRAQQFGTERHFLLQMQFNFLVLGAETNKVYRNTRCLDPEAQIAAKERAVHPPRLVLARVVEALRGGNLSMRLWEPGYQIPGACRGPVLHKQGKQDRRVTVDASRVTVDASPCQMLTHARTHLACDMHVRGGFACTAPHQSLSENRRSV
jgi:hypothetical protein